MHEQPQPLAESKIFALTPDALARFATLHTVADQYRVVAISDDGITPGAVDGVHIYWDTADYRLLRTGFAARLAQSGDQLHLSVENLATALAGKLDKPISRRVTITEPIAAGKVTASLKAWPKPLRKAVAAVLSGHAKLQPILRMQHQCTHYTVTAPTAENPAQLAQLNLDLVTVWAATDPATDDLNHPSAPDPERAITTLGQLRLACSPSVATEGTALTAWLISQFDLEPTRQSLLERALLVAGLHVPGAATTLQATMPVAEACRLIWREQLVQLLLHEAGARYSQDREYVHEMRVAIRRARAAAKLYGDFLPRKTIRPYLAALRKTGRVLGHVRNLDVAISKGRRLRTADGENVRAPKKLLKEWQKQRHVAQQALVKWLDSAEYGEFLSDFQQFCTTEKLAEKRAGKSHARVAAATPQQVRHVIPALIMACYAEVRCYEDSFATDLLADLTTDLSTDTPVDTAVDTVVDTVVDYVILHDLRIACKSLRYNLEFAQHLLGPESAVLIQQVKALQDLLGDLNDVVTALALLKKAENAAAASAYQQAQNQLMVDLSARVPAALAALLDKASRQLLGQALAVL